VTTLAWIAVAGPIVGLACGIAVGYFAGKAASADDLGAMGERVDALKQILAATRAELEALAAAPPTRRESARVLDMVAPRSTA
jgi:hypothetical protein